jgi:sn-glycerol 3-phosphate transport system permease protein
VAPAARHRRGVLLLARPGQALLPVGAASRTPSARSSEFVGLENFRAAVRRPAPTCASFRTTAVFSVLVAVHRAGRVAAAGAASPTGSCAARRPTSTLLIWPYAVAPAVAGVLWLFMFAPSRRRA